MRFCQSLAAGRVLPHRHMKRIALLGPVPGVPWDAQVLEAVSRGDCEAVIKLVSQYGGVRRLREGFTIGGQNGTTFARLCLHTQSVTVLRALVEAAPNGVTLQDCCTFHVEDSSGLSIFSNMVLHEEALNVEHPSAEAMALALALQPDHPCLESPLPRFDGASLHHEALKNATHDSKLAKVVVWAECARLLMKFGAPIEHNKGHLRSTATRMFFASQGNPDAGFAAVLVPLLNDYVKAGWVDIDAPVVPGHTPLRLAITSGNGHAAAAAIDLGCNLEAAVLDDFPDLISLAEHCVGRGHHPSLVTLVTDALMRRRLNELDATRVPSSTPAPAHRRAQRAHI